MAWIGLRVALFVDGAFWHGHPDYYRGQSGEFWDKKIAGNRARDDRVNAELSGLGWRVIRLWDFEVANDPQGSVDLVVRVLGEARSERETGRTHVREPSDAMRRVYRK